MTTKQRAVKIDRRTMAWLDAAVIDCVNRQDKCRAAVLIDELAHDDIEVTFDQVVKSVRRLGFTWADAFLPASKAERNGGHKQAEPKNATAATGPDMRAVLNRIEQLEQTLTRRGLAEYSGLRQQAHEQAQLATDRAKTLIDRIAKLEKELLEKRYAEYAWLVQHSRDEARLAAERSAALRSDIRTLLHLLDQQAQPKQPPQETQP